MDHFPVLSPSPNENPKRRHESDGDDFHSESKKLRAQLEAECVVARPSAGSQPAFSVESIQYDAFHPKFTDSTQYAFSSSGNAQCMSKTLDPTASAYEDMQTDNRPCLQPPDASAPSAFANVSISQDSGDMEWTAAAPTLNPVNAFTMFDGGSPWDDSESNEHDSCFGVLVVNATSTFDDAKSIHAPVELKVFGDMVKLISQESNKYAGIIKVPILSKLLNEDNVKLTATLIGSSELPEKGSTEKENEQWPRECTVRIVVHGMRRDRVAVGNLLSDAGLYLQHPSIGECDDDVEYCNPHYLVRPGAQLPQLGQYSTQSHVRTAESSRTLTELNKNRLMRIFDYANDDGISPQMMPSSRLSSILKAHQLIALAMMSEKECGIVEAPAFPSLWERTDASWSTKRYRNVITGIYTNFPVPVRGGILADDMGLGKTLSTLALICWSLDTEKDESISRKTLVVTPKSTLPSWQQQIHRHIYPGQVRVAVYHGSTRGTSLNDLKDYDIVLTTYGTLRADWTTNQILYQEEWYRVVLDEAHHIRNRTSQLFKAACAINSQYRWCLTGTPIHNMLDDYGALLGFLNVPHFAEKPTFDFWITTPIQNKDREGFRRLQSLVKATCLRRTKEKIGQSFNLPARAEDIVYVDLSPGDQELYNFFKTKTINVAAGMQHHNPGAVRSISDKEDNMIVLLNSLRQICNHGQQLLPESALSAWNARDNTATAWEMTRDEARSFLTPSVSSPSAKIEALLRNLRLAHASENQRPLETPIKSVVFTMWTRMLDLIQQALELHGFVCCRIDGSTSLNGRRETIRQFNEDPNCTIMLASIGSAGEGLDLTVANHVHLMEPHWNPMAESQAVDRVYRIGQSREVVIKRYIVRNSIETYIQWIQQQKLRLVSQFVDLEEATQSEIDMERWKELQRNLGG